MGLTIATWNINSVRLRQDLVLKLLKETGPDVLCLQEIKCTDEQFPGEAFAAIGYPHQVVRGQKAYNGVAVLSRAPIAEVEAFDMCGVGDARHQLVEIDGRLRIHNFYVPAGGDEPDADRNPKFDHKLRFVDEMKDRLDRAQTASVLVGDLNIAPLEHDVWSHKQMLKVVSHTPAEVEKLSAAQDAGAWVDAARRFTPHEEKLYSWWSYRARDWSASDRGRRLDHIWASPDLAAGLRSSVTLREVRGWEKPSDHAPVFATVDL
ncbi:MAG: exodeoxyribonuclease III [Pseudomonadota bacterium]